MEYQDYEERHLNKKKKAIVRKRNGKKKKTGQIATARRLAKLKGRIREVLRFYCAYVTTIKLPSRNDINECNSYTILNCNLRESP